MNLNRPRRTLATIAFVAGAVLAASVAAQSGGGPYRVDPATVASGGGTASGGTFRLDGTFGQAASATLAAADYRFYGGFWAPHGPLSDAIFANGFDP